MLTIFFSADENKPDNSRQNQNTANDMGDVERSEGQHAVKSYCLNNNSHTRREHKIEEKYCSRFYFLKPEPQTEKNNKYYQRTERFIQKRRVKIIIENIP